MSTQFNREQSEAIKHLDGPLLIIAGAGTGKTTVITERIKYLLTKKKVKPDEILALTFTEKAAFEMEERIDKIMPYGYTQLWISTFHAFCDHLLRLEAINFGINPAYRLLTESESLLFLKKNIFKLRLEYFRPLGNPNKFLESLLVHFSRLSDEDITPDEYVKFAYSLDSELKTATEEKSEEIKKIQELANAYKTYEELKIKEGVMDFSNLISFTLTLLRTRKHILKRYQEQFKYILVDEFQDTNYAQNELAILFSGSRKNITVVGDDDQAVYKWRGASLSNIIQFKNNFPGAKIITLSKNYRSTQSILDHSYKVIQNNNPNRLEALENINKHLTSERKIKGTKPIFLKSQRIDQEAETIIVEIKKILTKDTYTYNDIAILVRANNHSQAISQALQRAKIPYQFLGPGQLFLQEEVKDLISYLKVLYNLEDSVSLFRVLNMDILSFSARDINYLLNTTKKKNLSLFETLEKIDESYLDSSTKEKVKILTTMILRHLERIKKDTAGQILYYFMSDTGMLNQFLEFKTQQEEQIVLNISKFFDKIKTFETVNRDTNVYAVVEWIDLMMEMGDSPLIADVDTKEANAVNILTVHSSKGLEFPVVFMVNLVSDRFPTRERKEKIPIPQNLIKEILPEGDYHMQEERRLFYVGMTRARDLLYFTASSFYGEGKREKKISPFVYEALPEELKNQKQHPKQPTQLSFTDITKDYLKEPPKKDSVAQGTPLKLTSISYSQLQSFDICPLHYKARYLLNIPTPMTASLSFGISIHAVMKEIYDLLKNGQTITESNLLSLLRKNWISEGFQEKSHEQYSLKKAEQLLTNYYHKHFNPDNQPLATELPFSFYSNKLRITGKIDRIDKIANNGIEIIDYKTGSLDQAYKSAYKFQLGLYALAATKVDNDIFKRKSDNVTVSLYYLETDEKISEKLSQEDLIGIEQKIREKVHAIETSDFACSKSIICANCEYKMLCNVI